MSKSNQHQHQHQAALAHPIFFPIPNPLPHIRSADIPEPIILPPGTHPWSAFNPNSRLPPALDAAPSPTQVTKTPADLHSFNVDSTKTTDLTTSEHAGGRADEPTTESTASHSPGNSEVVVDHDVMITETRSKNLVSFHCDLCNAICTTVDMLKMHKQGKRHLKNMQKLALYQGPQKKKMKPSLDLLQNEASVGLRTTLAQPSNSGPQERLTGHRIQWCEVCKVSCSNESDLGRHVLGKKHLKNVKNSTKLQSPSLTNTVSVAMAPVTKPVEDLKSTDCDIVNSEFLGGKVSWSCNVLGSHASGKDNTNGFVKLEKIPDVPSTSTASLVENPIKGRVTVNSEEGRSLKCELCRITCNTHEMLKQHIAGKKHQKKMKQLFPPEGSLQDSKDEEGKVVILKGCKRKANSSLASDEKKLKMMKEEEASFALCTVVYDGSTAFISPVAGKKHSAVLFKLTNAGSTLEEV